MFQKHSCCGVVFDGAFTIHNSQLFCAPSFIPEKMNTRLTIYLYIVKDAYMGIVLVLSRYERRKKL